MADERRNLYRILHVQPEAPLEVIKASYRTLMSTLRAHPDLGGDPDAAARINAAYAVLTDPARRSAYDRALARAAAAARPGQRVPPAPPLPPVDPRPQSPVAAAARNTVAGRLDALGAETRTGPDPATWLADRVCPFCRRPLPVLVKVETRCEGCESPVFRRPLVDRGELFGRRRSPRNARPMPAMLRVPQIPGDHAARLRDISLSGLSLMSSIRVPDRSAVRVMTAGFDAVMVVVSCRRSLTDGWLLHGELLTLQLLRTQGVFVSAQA